MAGSGRGGGGGGGGGVRVSIPASARRMIGDIKDFGCNHSDEEIYAMLKECAMDPNEAAQKLLLQDTFHEVRSKREKRKENTREPGGSRWRPALQGRGGRGGRRTYSSRGVSSDDPGGRSISGKENGPNQGPELLLDKGDTTSVMTETDGKLTSSKISSGTVTVKGPNNMKKDVPSQPLKEESHAVGIKKGSSKLFSDDVKGVYSSASDPVLVPSLETHSTGKIGIIKRVVGSQRTTDAVTRSASHDVATGCELSSSSEKVSCEGSSFRGHEKAHTKAHGSEGNQLPHTSQVGSPSMAPPSSRPSSNYSNRSQQPINSQKVGPNKEWKPKSVAKMSPQVSVGFGASDSPVLVEAIGDQLPASASNTMEETAKKLEELQLAESHVIIPSHIQVSESEIQRLNFGSFDAGFKMNIGFAYGSESDKSVEPLSVTSREIEENTEQLSKSTESITQVTDEVEYPDHPQTSSPMHVNNPSTEAAVPNISAGAEHDEDKQKPHLGPEAAYPGFGLVPQMLGSHLAPIDSSETQAHDSSRVPSFVVQQPFAPAANYYTQFYRQTADADGHFSPSLAPGSSKYSGNIVALPAQTAQSPQESGSSIVLSAAVSTPLTVQAAGPTQSSISVTQQPVPVFRHPVGLHLSHYPTSYLPYGQYFSPYFVPPPLHHFVSSSAFPQQPPSGNTFTPPGAAAAAAPLKYSLAQYKPGNSTIVGMLPGYGNYNPGPAVSNANSTGIEDINSSQFKESNAYIGGQQSEAPAVWIPAPGRDLSGLPASSFYNIPPQGQHITFSPSQAAHGGFSGIYHPAPTVATPAVHPLLQQSQTGAGAGEVIGPPGGIYQQPQQRSQINWTNNY